MLVIFPHKLHLSKKFGFEYLLLLHYQWILYICTVTLKLPMSSLTYYRQAPFCEGPHLIWMCLKYEICLNLARRERERGLLNFSHLNDSLIFCPLWLQLVTVDLILLNFKDISTISPDWIFFVWKVHFFETSIYICLGWESRPNGVHVLLAVTRWVGTTTVLQYNEEPRFQNMVHSSKALDYASLLAKELNGLLMKVHTVSFFLKPIFNNTVKHIYLIRLQCFQIIESENLNQRPVKVKVPVVHYCSIGVWDRRSHRICFNYRQLDPRFHQTHIIHNFFTATKPDLTSKGTSNLD